jgi:hypothetical protein
MKKSTKILLFLVTLFTIIVLSSCAHPEPIQSCLDATKVHGFWFGLWNGITAGVSFIGSLFDKTIAVYAVNNNGGWYNFGFLLGVGGLFGGGVSLRSRD